MYRDKTTGKLCTKSELISLHPNTSFPKVWGKATLEFLNVDAVLKTPKPTPSSELKVVYANGVEQDSNGNWVESWKEVDRHTTDEDGTKEDKDATFLSDLQAAKIESVKVGIQMKVQERLDAFAATKGYFNAVSASSYATSKKPKWRAEGQYIVDARDATWDVLYAILAEVEAGTRAVPASFEEIEPELPVLTWPGE